MEGVSGNFCAHRAKVLLLQGHNELEIIQEHGTLRGTKRAQGVAPEISALVAGTTPVEVSQGPLVYYEHYS